MVSAVRRGLSHPVLPDAGVCWDPSLFPGDVPGSVHVGGRPRRVEAHAHDERQEMAVNQKKVGPRLHKQLGSWEMRPAGVQGHVKAW